MQRKILIFLSIVVLVLSISSCKSKPSQKPNVYEKKDIAPGSLNRIYENVNSIFKDLEKVKKVAVEPEKSEEKKEELGSKSKDKGSKKTEETKEEKLEKLWDNMNKSISEMHKSWNTYEIEGMKKGVITDSIGKFEESLNKFTLAVENRDHYNIINSGSEVYLYLAPFFDLYKDELKGNLTRIKYYVYNAYLMGEKGEVDKANVLITQSEIYLNNMRQKLGKDEKKLKILEKLSFSIQDMKGILKERNSNLLKIKRNILLRNIEELEK